MESALLARRNESTTMSNLIIRPVRRADLDALQKMITALAAHHGDNATLSLDHLHRDIFGAQPWIHVSVACIAEKIIGYHALCPLVKLQYCRRGMDMHHLFVSADHRGKGVGRRLIEDAVARALALDCFYLTVGTAPGNTAAQAAYLACGFTRFAQNADRFYVHIN